MSALERTTVDFGRPVAVVRGWGERFSQRLDMRSLVVTLVVLTIAVVVALVTLASGEFEVRLDQVIGALLGQASPRVHMVVVEWRLPRTLLALILGAALGIGGAIFQSLTRNPLGSPDIIGFDAGAYTGALVVIIIFHGGYYEVAGGAMLGGLITAAAVYLLAWKRGVQGFRLIVVGIGVSAMLGSLNTWMLLKAELMVAMAAAMWGAGSLNGLGFDKLIPVLVVLAVLVPILVILSRPLRQLELGDDAAAALGVSTERSRLALVVVGVAFTALVTAAAGPITFVALAAPQIAARLTRSAGVALIPAAATGALLLAAADYIAQRGFAPTQLPVGIVTVSLGGLYFAWLMMREARRG